MSKQMMGLALAATALTVLAGCSSTGSTADTTGTAADSGLGQAPDNAPGEAPSKTPSHAPSKAAGRDSNDTPATPINKTKGSTTTAKPAGPEIVYFRIAQQPRCAEGTDVYQNHAVPLIIKWKISHATSGALSVDDPTHTPGTYGPVSLTGSQDFTFSCAGAVGSVETHTYAIYSVGGGTQRSKTLTISTKILDKGTTVS
jgi:hypothetical protein